MYGELSPINLHGAQHKLLTERSCFVSLWNTKLGLSSTFTVKAALFFRCWLFSGGSLNHSEITSLTSSHLIHFLKHLLSSGGASLLLLWSTSRVCCCCGCCIPSFSGCLGSAWSIFARVRILVVFCTSALFICCLAACCCILFVGFVAPPQPETDLSITNTWYVVVRMEVHHYW